MSIITTMTTTMPNLGKIFIVIVIIDMGLGPHILRSRVRFLRFRRSGRAVIIVVVVADLALHEYERGCVGAGGLRCLCARLARILCAGPWCERPWWSGTIACLWHGQACCGREALGALGRDVVGVSQLAAARRRVPAFERERNPVLSWCDGNRTAEVLSCRNLGCPVGDSSTSCEVEMRGSKETPHTSR